MRRIEEVTVRSLPILLLAAFLLVGCGEDIKPGREAGKATVVPGLTLQQVSTAEVSDARSFPGIVESRDRGILAARLDARVARVLVKEGDLVEAGTLLISLAENTAGDRFREAEAGLREAQAVAAAARAQLELAEQELARFGKLRKAEAVTPQEFDRVSAQAEIARQQLAAAENAVQRATAARESARISLGYTQIEAPFRARVATLNVKEGSTVMPGTPLAVLDRDDGWQVRVEFPEGVAGSLSLGSPMQLNLSGGGSKLSGQLVELSAAADPLSHTLTARIGIPGAREGLVAGMYVRVTPEVGPQETILIPAGAVVERGQLTGVYVVEAGLLHYRLVCIGRSVEGKLEVLSGLQPGETIVVGGVEKARHGARVED